MNKKAFEFTQKNLCVIQMLFIVYQELSVSYVLIDNGVQMDANNNHRVAPKEEDHVSIDY